MDHSPGYVLARTLYDLGHVSWDGEDSSWPVCVSKMPDRPDNLVTVHTTSGRTQGRLQTTGRIVTFPGIQIVVRSASERLGFPKAQDLLAAVDEEIQRTSVSVPDYVGTASTSYLVHSVTRQSNIIPLGRQTESSKLELWAINCIISLSLL